MPASRKEIGHELIVRVRTDYAAGKPTRTIMRETGLSSGTFYKILDGDYGAEELPTIQRRHSLMGARGRGGRMALVARLWSTADRQVREIEKRLRRGAQQPTDRERDARVLAVLVRTLRDLNAFDQATKAAGAAMDPAEHDDMPTDIDEFRNELARRINAFVDEREGDGVPAAAPAADE